jgi:hypothetical protein
LLPQLAINCVCLSVEVVLVVLLKPEALAAAVQVPATLAEKYSILEC